VCPRRSGGCRAHDGGVEVPGEHVELAEPRGVGLPGDAALADEHRRRAVRRRDHLAEDRLDAVGDTLEAPAPALDERAGREAGALVGVVTEPGEHTREPVGRRRVHEHAVRPVDEDVGGAAHSRGRERRAARERLDRDVREPLVGARVDQHVVVAEPLEEPAVLEHAEEAHPVSAVPVARTRLQLGRGRALADHVERDAGRGAHGVDEDVDMLVRDEPAHVHGAQVLVRGRGPLAGLGHAHAVGDQPDLVGIGATGPARDHAAELGAGDDDRGRGRHRPVAQRPHEPQARATAGPGLEPFELGVGESQAPAPLPRGVADHLHDDGKPGEAGTGDRRLLHPRRVDDVEARPVAGDPTDRGGVAHRPRPGARDPHDPVVGPERAFVRGREHRHEMATRAEFVRQIGGVGGGPADVGRKDPRHHHHAQWSAGSSLRGGHLREALGGGRTSGSLQRAAAYVTRPSPEGRGTACTT